MNMRLEVEEFVCRAKDSPVLDVRSPGEFEKGHLPQAISFPLFDNHERAEIGTLYKEAGQAAAIERGMEMIQPRIRDMYHEGIAQARDGKLLVHCWRGGKRSESVASMLAVSGLDVATLAGGYKAFRNWVLRQFVLDYPISIIGGATGTGKTEVLHQLGEMGERILDLEDLADHRGSSFGRLGATRKVTPAQFENEMAWRLYFSEGEPLWVEDESRTIGSLYIPIDFWKQMETAEMYFIELPLEVRMERLMRDYGHFSREQLRSAIERIGRRLGGLRLREVMEAFERDDTHTTLHILLEYYDKAYHHTLARKPNVKIHRLPFPDFDAPAIAKAILALR